MPCKSMSGKTDSRKLAILLGDIHASGATGLEADNGCGIGSATAKQRFNGRMWG